MSGGFLFLDLEDELAVLEALIGIPRGEIIQSLRLMDGFIAPDGESMFYTIKGRLLCLKLVPGLVRGIGSFLRLDLFDLKGYDAKYSDLGWLSRNGTALRMQCLSQSSRRRDRHHFSKILPLKAMWAR
jgi:hypothetical protein